VYTPRTQIVYNNIIIERHNTKSTAENRRIQFDTYRIIGTLFKYAYILNTVRNQKYVFQNDNRRCSGSRDMLQLQHWSSETGKTRIYIPVSCYFTFNTIAFGNLGN